VVLVVVVQPMFASAGPPLQIASLLPEQVVAPAEMVARLPVESAVG
jgi:hypothetical protein